MRPAPTKKTLGYLAAFTIVFLWSGWIVTSRFGATSALTIYDITAMRYGISGLIVLPIAFYYKPWRGLTIRRIAAVSLFSGFPYTLVVYQAFTLAPAAHGGVFMNGVLPAITVGLGWLWFKDKPHRVQIGGTVLIIIGASVTLFGSDANQMDTSWQGDLLFMLGGLCFALYMVMTRLWSLTATQVLFCSSVVNGVIFTPLWFFFLPSGLSEASALDIGLQALYQGILATLFGMVIVAFAVRHIGAPPTAAFMSGVPAIAAFLGVLLLGEEFGLMGWISILILTPGVLMTALWNSHAPTQKT
ncbi:DMT family transporter [Sneathiella aquimaris]|uniref:DMT family transporter n=1 Tax=Sneathiella aquimaris TaxID=2599305 RepID=UPI00146D8F59|nr:DMT family transporter [Sneathiella aquimaris]